MDRPTWTGGLHHGFPPKPAGAGDTKKGAICDYWLPISLSVSCFIEQEAYNLVMPTTLKIFYAWQSDTPDKLNHYFVRDACEEAIKKLNAEAEIQEAPSFELDHDTKGVPGTPSIADTICKKIDECDIFIADLTTVGEYARTSDSIKKKAQNANVLIELGYARRTKGLDRLILVMNSAFGASGDLPFDLQNLRRPVQYSLSDSNGPEFKTERKALADNIAAAIGAVMENVLALESARHSASLDAAIKNADEVRKDFERSSLSNNFHGFDGENAILTFCLIPLEPLAELLDLAKRGDAICQVIRPFNAGRFCKWEHDQHSEVIFDPGYTPNGKIGRKTVVELWNGGHLFAAVELPKMPVQRDMPHQAVAAGTPVQACESELFARLQSYVNVLRSEHVDGPLLFGLSLHRINGLLLLPEGVYYDSVRLRPFGVNSVVTQPVVIEGKPFPDDPNGVGMAIKPALDQLWRAAGLPYDPFLGA